MWTRRFEMSGWIPDNGVPGPSRLYQRTVNAGGGGADHRARYRVGPGISVEAPHTRENRTIRVDIRKTLL